MSLSQFLNVSESDTPIIASIKGNLRARLLIRRVAYAVTKLTAPSASPNHGVWCRQSCVPPQPLGAACRMAHAGSNGCHQASLTSLARRVTFPYWQERSSSAFPIRPPNNSPRSQTSSPSDIPLTRGVVSRLRHSPSHPWYFPYLNNAIFDPCSLYPVFSYTTTAWETADSPGSPFGNRQSGMGCGSFASHLVL